MATRADIAKKIKEATHTPPYVPKAATQASQLLPKINIDTITAAAITNGQDGKNLRLAFHALKAAKGSAGASLPKSINVIVGKQKLEAIDATGAGTYVLDLRYQVSRFRPDPW